MHSLPTLRLGLTFFLGLYLLVTQVLTGPLDPYVLIYNRGSEMILI